VGESFAVIKVSGLAGLADAVDVSLPRRDSKAGPGHRGIAVHGDPDLPLAEAARRRDFTVNAILYEPFAAEVVDPWGGRSDLLARRLRAVDAGTFGDDPLRALRGVQLAARFELGVDPATAALCASMPLQELPAERVFGEIEKLLLLAGQPSRGLRLLREWGMLPAVAPPLLPLADTPQDPEWHPEGDVWTHTLLAMDVAAGLVARHRSEAAEPDRRLDHARALTVMLAVLCHDLGKPATTVFDRGRLRSPGHEEAGLPPTEALLDRLKVHTLHGYDVRGQVLARADCLGRTGDFPPVAMDWFRARVEALAVERAAPRPLLQGRDLLALGLVPGPQIGRVLRAVYEGQLDGSVGDREQALAEARRLLTTSES